MKWESLTLNFVMVFSPNTLAGAPHNLLATVTLPKDSRWRARSRRRASSARPPRPITAIRVKDALDAFNAVFAR